MSEYCNKFSPSLLDSFSQYLDSEALYEKFYGFSEEPSLTFQEYEEKQFKELIDKVNRVPFDSESTDRGSCLNEIVDCIVLHVKSTRDDILIKTLAAYQDGMEESLSKLGCPNTVVDLVKAVNKPCILAKKGERTFLFDIDYCKSVAEYFKDSLCQVYTEAPIETRYGRVLLYGYPDYVRGDMVYDLKSTSKYEFGKYSKYWQQHLYPWTLIESGKCKDIRAFEFTAYAMKGGSSKTPLIYGEMYPELYVYDHKRSEAMLRDICEKFHEFLEAHRDIIRDKKIFGGENVSFEDSVEMVKKTLNAEIVE